MKPRSFAALARLLQTGSGLVIGPDKTYLLETRLAPILKRHSLRDLDALADRVRPDGSGALERRVIEAMTTNESFFFRDDKPFVHFRTQALPRLHAARVAGARLRIWSAAASAGQEAYSLAMILAECGASLNGRGVEIVGTDISGEQVERARAALHTQFEVQRGLPIQMLVKYFKQTGETWQINPELRAMIQHRQLNLLNDFSQLGTFDVIFCRNVLIYFDQDTKAVIFERLAKCLEADGTLLLGAAESVVGVTDAFRPVADRRGLYQLNPARGVRAAGAPMLAGLRIAAAR